MKIESYSFLQSALNAKLNCTCFVFVMIRYFLRLIDSYFTQLKQFLFAGIHVDMCTQCFSIFLLEWNPLEHLDRLRNPCSDTMVCSIPNGQKQHFSVLSNLHEKTPIVTGVCV